MTHNPTHRAFQRLCAYAANAECLPLDRMTTGNAAAWLAHANTYGVTADTSLLREIAEPGKNPVERAATLTRELVDAIAAARLPLSTPFQAVDLLYSEVDDDGSHAFRATPQDPFEDEHTRGPQP